MCSDAHSITLSWGLSCLIINKCVTIIQEDRSNFMGKYCRARDETGIKWFPAINVINECFSYVLYVTDP